MTVFDEKIGKLALNIGGVDLDGRALLAPMAGVTDVGMRRIARRFGAALVVSEMVAADDFARGDAESRLRAEGEGVDPHVVQIAGCDPRWMGEAAQLAEASGAAIVDINMGCPAKKVTGGLAGSALMREPDLAIELVRATVAAVKIPVTLKMRLGWDDASLNAPELAARAQAHRAMCLWPIWPPAASSRPSCKCVSWMKTDKRSPQAKQAKFACAAPP